MSTATYTIDATHFSPPLRRCGLPESAGLPRQSGPSCAPCLPPGGQRSWPLSSRLPWGRFSVSPKVQQWATMTAAQRAHVRPNRLLPLRHRFWSVPCCLQHLECGL